MVLIVVDGEFEAIGIRGDHLLVIQEQSFGRCRGVGRDGIDLDLDDSRNLRQHELAGNQRYDALGADFLELRRLRRFEIRIVIHLEIAYADLDIIAFALSLLIVFRQEGVLDGIASSAAELVGEGAVIVPDGIYHFVLIVPIEDIELITGDIHGLVEEIRGDGIILSISLRDDDFTDRDIGLLHPDREGIDIIIEAWKSHVDIIEFRFIVDESGSDDVLLILSAVAVEVPDDLVIAEPQILEDFARVEHHFARRLAYDHLRLCIVECEVSFGRTYGDLRFEYDGSSRECFLQFF